MQNGEYQGEEGSIDEVARVLRLLQQNGLSEINVQRKRAVERQKEKKGESRELSFSYEKQ